MIPPIIHPPLGLSLTFEIGATPMYCKCRIRSVLYLCSGQLYGPRGVVRTEMGPAISQMEALSPIRPIRLGPHTTFRIVKSSTVQVYDMFKLTWH
ncbi:hypothetical protein EVAR_98728_1 [Eumeta japonica]|uniref:Uncharacterized protein n=1 Tax=Eumeta variegata TaxID=151549 RepID=A0A4C1ZNS4_EUMVA|nr:hypothetical protein EVAR_98728_1 [Eumeta japonica]